ncbi:MAG TPA: hypothetical protein VFU59_08330 [Candidatus Eisenbacteria bacterium]|nr:hypothetical protein [Candidatus Eisenbacteria bacterium]
MILRFAFALLLALSFALVAAPPTAAADSCDTCPAAAGGGSDDCADDCPLCVCGPHRAPMTAPPSAPSLTFIAAAEFVPAGEASALSPNTRDILHVPRLRSASLPF